MKTITITKFSVIAITIFCLFFAACKKSKIDAVPVPKNNIAYIYKADNTDGLAYKTLLEENNCHVTLIDKANVAATNFSSYALIVIDHNTDAIGLTSSWTNADTAAIQASGSPMLLIGIGGLQYAGKLGNKANYLNTASWTDTKFFVSDKTSTLYSKPNSINIPTSTPAVTLYSSSQMGAGQLVPSGGTLTNVTLVGRFSIASTYYPLTIEKTRYTCFGFYKGVNDMNQGGKDFMVNLAFFVGKFSL